MPNTFHTNISSRTPPLVLEGAPPGYRVVRAIADHRSDGVVVGQFAQYSRQIAQALMVRDESAPGPKVSPAMKGELQRLEKALGFLYTCETTSDMSGRLRQFDR